MPVALIAVAVLLIALATLGLLLALQQKKLKRAEAEGSEARAQVQRLHAVEERYRGILDVEAEVTRLRQEGATLADQIQSARRHAEAEQGQLAGRAAELRRELAWLEEAAYFEAYGLYQPRYDFENSDKYRQRLETLRAQQKEAIKDGKAAICAVQWTVQGSAAKGRKMANDHMRLLLRAFNGECEALITKVRYNNVSALEDKIRRAHESLNKLGAVEQCSITFDYLNMKLDELRLFHEYQEKLQAEKEEQRRIQEQIREEKKALEEIEWAQREAEKEEARYQLALDKTRVEVEQATGAKHDRLMKQIEELQVRLTEAQANKERAISRAQQTRAGHVYVISNIGSFGEDVYKIGMTRRLEPLDRVRELGDASVPFSFDVHAIVASNDAPTLETTLHRLFHHRRVNRINERKEFFRVSLKEIEAAVRQHHGEIEFTLLAEAAEYRQSLVIERSGTVVPPRAERLTRTSAQRTKEAQIG